MEKTLGVARCSLLVARCSLLVARCSFLGRRSSSPLSSPSQKDVRVEIEIATGRTTVLAMESPFYSWNVDNHPTVHEGEGKRGTGGKIRNLESEGRCLPEGVRREKASAAGD